MSFRNWILLENRGLLVVNKPSGLIVEQNPFESPTVETLAWEYLKSTHKKPFLGIVHRLDRVTSGVLVLAKKKSVLKALNRQFAERQVQKTYFAVCTNPLPTANGTLIHWLCKDQKNKKALISETPREGYQKVQLNYRSAGASDGRYLVEVYPQSGKFHQIRAQFAAIGCPILGDVKYGGMAVAEERVIALHAQSLTLWDPVGEKSVRLEAPLPGSILWKGF